MTASLDWSLLVVVNLASVARERALLATVADTIVAAAVGKSLCVTVACPDSEVAFVGHLTRALHARGRTCRCLVPQLSSPGAAGVPPADSDVNRPTVMVITSGAGVPDEHDVCRINIHLTTDAPTVPTEDAPYQHMGDVHPDPDREPDIFLDFHDPSGPTIRHIAPGLSLPLPRS